jgi:hypothetical protein
MLSPLVDPDGGGGGGGPVITMKPRQHRVARRAGDRPLRAPAAARFSTPVDRSWPGPADRAAAASPDLDGARRHLQRVWSPGVDRLALLRSLATDFGCDRHQGEVLVAERDAVQRAVDAGLDPAPVRAQAERLLRDR